MIRIRSPGSRDAAAENRAARLRALGLEPRQDKDARDELHYLIPRPGLPPLNWRAVPVRGRLTKWRVIDEATGQVILCTSPRGILKAAHRLTPRVAGGRGD